MMVVSATTEAQACVFERSYTAPGGEAFCMNSVFPSPHAISSTSSSFAVKAGGGVDVALSRRLALRAIEANYLSTRFPNATNNEQNNLMLGAGVVLRF